MELVRIITSLHFGLVEGELTIETHYWDNHGYDSCYYFERENVELVFSKDLKDERQFVWINKGDYDELLELCKDNYEAIYEYYK